MTCPELNLFSRCAVDSATEKVCVPTVVERTASPRSKDGSEPPVESCLDEHTMCPFAESTPKETANSVEHGSCLAEEGGSGSSAKSKEPATPQNIGDFAMINQDVSDTSQAGKEDLMEYKLTPVLELDEGLLKSLISDIVCVTDRMGIEQLHSMMLRFCQIVNSHRQEWDRNVIIEEIRSSLK